MDDEEIQNVLEERVRCARLARTFRNPFAQGTPAYNVFTRAMQQLAEKIEEAE